MRYLSIHMLLLSVFFSCVFFVLLRNLCLYDCCFYNLPSGTWTDILIELDWIIIIFVTCCLLYTSYLQPCTKYKSYFWCIWYFSYYVLQHAVAQVMLLNVLIFYIHIFGFSAYLCSADLSLSLSLSLLLQRPALVSKYRLEELWHL